MFVNRYGLTETGNVCLNRIHGVCHEHSTLPVGPPVEGHEILILDEHIRPVEPGREGEVAIKSCYLTSGYFGRSDLDAKAFIPLPPESPERLFRTGDVGFLRPDGHLVHLGRKDFQVKIRGFRIETGEIEGVLADSGMVREAAVVARTARDGEDRLVAYVVPKGAAIDTRILRSSIRSRLPSYMEPACFVVLKALPLAPNGKLAWRQLPDPDTVSDDSRRYTAPHVIGSQRA
jgi:acyl-coenzyme A synthetase/AMP-(fatty) acid ligase